MKREYMIASKNDTMMHKAGLKMSLNNTLGGI